MYNVFYLMCKLTPLKSRFAQLKLCKSTKIGIPPPQASIPPCQDPPACQIKEAMTSVEDLIHKWCFLRGIFETLSQSPMT